MAVSFLERTYVDAIERTFSLRCTSRLMGVDWMFGGGKACIRQATKVAKLSWFVASRSKKTPSNVEKAAMLPRLEGVRKNRNMSIEKRSAKSTH